VSLLMQATTLHCVLRSIPITTQAPTTRRYCCCHPPCRHLRLPLVRGVMHGHRGGVHPQRRRPRCLLSHAVPGRVPGGSCAPGGCVAQIPSGCCCLFALMPCAWATIILSLWSLCCVSLSALPGAGHHAAEVTTAGFSAAGLACSHSMLQLDIR
jgi:hypothetical protein